MTAESKIVLTGGGTAGHVIPHLALLPHLKKHFGKIYYIGSHDGIEKEIIKEHSASIDYHSVTTVKLRRSLDLRNLAIPFKLFKGIREAKKILKKLKPDIVFSKGGFVAYPVVRAAAAVKIPVIAHESDITMGLANKMSAKYCKTICTTFAVTAKGKKNMVYTGSPIREKIFNGDSVKVQQRHGFDENKGNLLIVGGSLGAAKINYAVREALPKLDYNIVHICGKGKILDSVNKKGYVGLEFVNDIEHYFAWAHVVVSRAGSNAMCELLALGKAILFIPLSKAQSRGDQIDNAKEVMKTDSAAVLLEEDLTAETLIKKIDESFKNKEKYAANTKRMSEIDGTKKIANVIVQSLGDGIKQNLRNEKKLTKHF